MTSRKETVKTILTLIAAALGVIQTSAKCGRGTGLVHRG